MGLLKTKTKIVSRPKSILRAPAPVLLPAFVLLSLGLGVVNIGATFFLALGTFSLAGKEPSRILEKSDGTTAKVIYTDSSSPSPEVIKQHVAETLFGLYDWRGFLEPETPEEYGAPKPDPGVALKVGNSTKRITSATWKHGFRFTEEYRPELMRQIASMTPQTLFSGNGGSATIVPRNISPPESIGEGQWKVIYQGILLIFANGDNIGEEIPIRHEVYLYEIGHQYLKDAPQYSNQKEFSKFTDLQRMLAEANDSGLLIYSMPFLKEVK